MQNIPSSLSNLNFLRKEPIFLLKYQKSIVFSTDTYTSHPVITDTTEKLFYIQNYPLLQGLKKIAQLQLLLHIRSTFIKRISVSGWCHRKCHYDLLYRWKLTYFKTNVLKIILLYKAHRVSRHPGCFHGGVDTWHTDQLLFLKPSISVIQLLS